MDLVNWARIELMGYRCPLKIELVRVAIPFGILIFFAGLMLGYMWAMKAYSSFGG